MDERTLEVAPDAALEAAARTLAERAAALGRPFALVTLSAEDRARVLRASAGVAGVAVAAVGEGRLRRVVFTPERPVPVPKRTNVPYDVEDDLDDADDAEDGPDEE